MTHARLWLRRISSSLLVLLLALASLTAHTVVQGEAEMKLSDQAFDAGNVRQSAYHARRAAVYYAPGVPHVSAAYARLLAVASGAEAQGDTDTALFAWRAVRGAAVETRHVTGVRGQELEQANHALARLQVTTKAPVNEREALTQRKLAARDLSQGEKPRAAWILLLAFGFLSASVGVAWFSLRGIDKRGALRWTSARASGLLLFVGLLCWTWAVVTA